jgi:ATP adenylyltransferase
MSSGIPRLWAPWRGEWIQEQKNIAPEDKGLCPFCTLPLLGATRENLILFTDDDIAVIMNKFPYNPGHLMVIPRAHVSYPHELEPRIWNKVSQAIPLVMKCVEASMSPQGFNLGMNLGQAGGAGIPGHIHWHILPRWVGDTNFMPLIAETKAISAHNQSVYERLSPAFEGFAEKLYEAMIKST